MNSKQRALDPQPARPRVAFSMVLAALVTIVSPALAADNNGPIPEGRYTEDSTTSSASRPIQKARIKDKVKNAFAPKLQNKHLEKMYYKNKLVYHVTLPPNVESIKKKGLRPEHGGGDKGLSEAIAPPQWKETFKKDSTGYVHLGDENAMKGYHELTRQSGREPHVFAVRRRGLTLHRDQATIAGEGYRVTENIKPKHLVHVTNDQFNDITRLPTLNPHRPNFVPNPTARAGLAVKHSGPKPHRQFRAKVQRGVTAVFRSRGRHR
jgi:hypothetical protein